MIKRIRKATLNNFERHVRESMIVRGVSVGASYAQIEKILKTPIKRAGIQKIYKRAIY